MIELWSTSYLLFMSGTCGACLAACYAAVDYAPKGGVDDGADSSDPGHSCDDIRSSRLVARAQAILRQVLFPLQAMGMNAILFFFWHGTAEVLINAFYYDPPVPGGGLSQPVEGASLLGPHGWIHEQLLGGFGGEATRQLVYVLMKLVVYLCVAVACWRAKYFWKL